MSLEALFCDVDDFCQIFLSPWYAQQLTRGERKRLRATRLSVSEIMTILIHFHQSHYWHFKGYMSSDRIRRSDFQITDLLDWKSNTPTC